MPRSRHFTLRGPWWRHEVELGPRVETWHWNWQGSRLARQRAVTCQNGARRPPSAPAMDVDTLLVLVRCDWGREQPQSDRALTAVPAFASVGQSSCVEWKWSHRSRSRSRSLLLSNLGIDVPSAPTGGRPGPFRQGASSEKETPRSRFKNFAGRRNGSRDASRSLLSGTVPERRGPTPCTSVPPQEGSKVRWKEIMEALGESPPSSPADINLRERRR